MIEKNLDKINPIDEDWKTWQKNYLKFYTDNQKESIGTTVNHYGFKIVENIDFNKKNIMKLDPSGIEHINTINLSQNLMIW